MPLLTTCSGSVYGNFPGIGSVGAPPPCAGGGCGGLTPMAQGSGGPVVSGCTANVSFLPSSPGVYVPRSVDGATVTCAHSTPPNRMQTAVWCV